MTLLWSIVPTDDVFNHELYGGGVEPNYITRQLPTASASMVLSDMGAGMGRIERIISTNPNDYLKPELQPGCLVRLADFDAVSD